MTTMNEARVSPVFRYRDAGAAMTWLEQAFGFTTAERHAAPDGSIVHAEMRHGPSAIGLSTAGAVVADNPWTNVRSGLYVCTAAVDDAHRQAVDAGASLATPLTDTSYGAREFSVRDPKGHLWSFGTYGMAAAAGEPTIFPALKCRNAEAEIDWLTRALGLTPGMTVAGDGGGIKHAELSLGRDTVMLGGSDGEALWGDDIQCTCVYVDAVDRHHEQAIGHGATIVQPLADAPWGSRGYYVRDLEGFIWGFSNYRAAGRLG